MTGSRVTPPSPSSALVRASGIRRVFDVSPPLLTRLLEGKSRRWVRAVDGIDFSINSGETYALVGESGCGKSTVAQLVVGLLPTTGGEVIFDGVCLNSATRPSDRSVKAARVHLRRRMAMIFQDPYASLNPRWRVDRIINEPIHAFGLISGAAAISRRVSELLVEVGLSPRDGRKFPHEFSGGQRQRISIARALASEPEFIVCDEPTSALDVSVQAQILNLMKDLQREFGLAYLFISHDLAVVRHMAHAVGVMYLGKMCETAPVDVIFDTPRHPYTRMLLDTIPDIEMTGRTRTTVGGEIPNPIHPPGGCAFHPRCPLAEAVCSDVVPPLEPADTGALVACHMVPRYDPD
jgi:peptide/nickel transport system ATP-binding protein